ncbi:DUF1236 domain-containing protein [Phreatobacter sp. AB_2022a]|uniref:DUF1236 domain-containing protein n=1 Tax=Phreatobacter sp. AB_2022a TaxID=3003134 RepID=UPI00228756E9|nr:DUF1236 domain-containing protein [Phreatobacter sp. AB_2022a]MCZ0736386.1 DUF1236 domain-containing protein [Phreatobacter sp. AB_2022a]
MKPISRSSAAFLVATIAATLTVPPVQAQVGDSQSSPTASTRPQRISPDQQPRFRRYVIERHHPSYSYGSPVIVGAVLPEDGVTTYPVPSEYGTTSYRYTIVNERPVLVDPTTRMIVQLIEEE